MHENLISERVGVYRGRNYNAIGHLIKYLPFGEGFIEERNNSWNTPYLFNGKELDEGTGLYYYGARYYNPRESVWLSTDPLSGYNPVMEVEHYIDGQHNGGVYNSFNHNTYGYCYQSPVKLVDPNGKQVVAIHGTWSNPDTWKNQKGIERAVQKVFGTKSIKITNFNFKWSGGNYKSLRTKAAIELVSEIQKIRNKNNMMHTDPISLVGHSHGGNVAIEAINLMVGMEEFNEIKINLLTINTPVREDYQLSEASSARVNHINIYDIEDPIQIRGGNSSRLVPDRPSAIKFTGEYGSSERIFKQATNISVDNPQGLLGDFHNSHNRIGDWINQLSE
jgi:RHS repeat-associated protein